MIRRLAAIVALTGGILIVAGCVVWFGVPGGLISAGLLLVAAGASNL